MPVHAPFEDEVLGHVTWNAEENCWECDAGPIRDAAVSGRYIPEDSEIVPADESWNNVRASVRWVRQYERIVRAYLRDKVSWCRDSPWACPVLSGINFYSDREARLIYSGWHVGDDSCAHHSIGPDYGP